MYAIVETGSKQYRVSKGDVLQIERLNTKEGKEVKLNKVLFPTPLFPTRPIRPPRVMFSENCLTSFSSA